MCLSYHTCPQQLYEETAYIHYLEHSYKPQREDVDWQRTFYSQLNQKKNSLFKGCFHTKASLSSLHACMCMRISV